MSLQLIPPDVNIDFVGKRRFFVMLSTAINIAAIFLLIFKGLNYGVDFNGGTVVQVRVTHATNADELRHAMAPLNLGEITVQDFGQVGQYLLRFEKLSNLKGFTQKLNDALTKAYGSNVVEVLRVESVGARVGRELRFDAIGAVAAATIFMGAFIAWQFRNISWSFG